MHTRHNAGQVRLRGLDAAQSEYQLHALVHGPATDPECSASFPYPSLARLPGDRSADASPPRLSPTKPYRNTRGYEDTLLAPR
jgi:hypothetical protein